MGRRFLSARIARLTVFLVTGLLPVSRAHAQTPPATDAPDLPPVLRLFKPKPLPPNADDYLRHAAVFFRMGDYARAIDHLTSAIALRPDLGELFRNRGNTYLQIAFAERRVQVYSSRLVSAPDSAVLHLGRGFAYYNAGDYDKAIVDCDEALSRYPGYAAAYLTRALAHDAAGHPAQAAADYARAFALQSRLHRAPRPEIEYKLL